MLTWFYFSESQLERIKPFLFFVSMADASSTVSYTSSTRTSVEGGSCWARPAQDPVQSVFQVEQTQCFNNHFTGLANQTLFDGSLMLDSTYLKAHRTAAILLKKGILHVSSVAQKEDWIPNFMPLMTATGGPSCFCWPKDRSAITRERPFSSTFFPKTASFWQTEGMMRPGCGSLWKRGGWRSAYLLGKPEMQPFLSTKRCINVGISLKIRSANWRTGGVSQHVMTAVPIPFSQPSALLSVLSFIFINESWP